MTLAVAPLGPVPVCPQGGNMGLQERVTSSRDEGARIAILPRRSEGCHRGRCGQRQPAPVIAAHNNPCVAAAGNGDQRRPPATGLRPIRQQQIRAAPRPAATAPVHLDPLQHRNQQRAITPLTRRDYQRQRLSALFTGQVRLQSNRQWSRRQQNCIRGRAPRRRQRRGAGFAGSSRFIGLLAAISLGGFPYEPRGPATRPRTAEP